MSKYIIKVDKISKKYNLNKTSSLTLNQSVKNLFRVKFRKKLNKIEDFWALSDVSFNMCQGEVLGIIGKNGAGKSTLLKIISRITKPTNGQIELQGRVASLLEVGTGFHHELTGRENVFLNGSILGMKYNEIKQKFDEIVDFSGVESFIDIPVKRYSSGMRVRLAFAVAAHLNPEILIIDEVLSVGDSEFRKKSLGKMSEVSKSGKTVIFVSHNMSAVKNICNKGLYLKNGQVEFIGDVDATIDKYLLLNSNKTKSSVLIFKDYIKGIKPFRLNQISLKNKNTQPTIYFNSSEEIYLHVEFTLMDILKGFRLGMTVLTTNEEILFVHYFHSENILQTGNYSLTFVIPRNILNEGTYKLRIHAGIPGILKLLNPEVFFTFNIIKTNLSSIRKSKLPGFFAPTIKVLMNKN